MNFIVDYPTEGERMDEVIRRRIARGDPNPYRRITPYDEGYYDVPNRFPPQWFHNLTNTARNWYMNQRARRYTPYTEGLNNQEEEERVDLPAPPVPPFSHIVPQQAPPVPPLQQMLPPPSHNNMNNNKQIPKPVEANEGDLACIICMENIADHCIIPCGHISLCSVCSNTLTQPHNFPRCPTCRGPITDIIQTFPVGVPIGVPHRAGGRKTKRSKKSRKINKSRKSHK
jgi:hypothetical protein